MNKTQKAADTARQLVTDTASAADERTSAIVTDSIREFFNEQQDNKRFLDVARIPFICDDIKNIKTNMEAQSTKIDSFARLLYIGIGIVMVAGILVPIFTTFIFKGVK